MFNKRMFVAALFLGLAATTSLLGIATLGDESARAEGAASGAQQADPDKQTATRKEPRTEAQLVAAIDSAIEAKWKEKNFTPSARSSDGEYLRRVYLDLVGRVPTLDETRSFLEDKSSDKRAALVRRLQSSDETADNLAEMWVRALTAASSGNKRQGLRPLQKWISGQIKLNRPWDEMTRDLITATGSLADDDEDSPGTGTPAGYIVSFNNDVNNITGNLVRAFLGIEIQCAQCHDHLLDEQWKQTHFLQFSAAFRATRVNRVPVEGSKKGGDRVFEIKDTRANMGPMGSRALERMGKNAKNEKGMEKAKEKLALMALTPTMLDGTKISGKTGADLREGVANWVTSPNNPWFAQAAVNRLWGYYTKRGFVEPVDDFNAANLPTNSTLLALMADDFKASGYDMARLTRVIMATRAYQLSSTLSKDNKDDRIWYSRGYIVQLTTAQTFDAMMTATGVKQIRDQRVQRELRQIRVGLLRKATSAADDDEGRETDSFTGTIPQALALMNGVLQATGQRGGTLDTILRKETTSESRINALYLSAFCRTPSKDELRRMESYLKAQGDSPETWEDMYWALLNSAEFLTNH